jgi:hypothetical protein
MAMNFVTFNQDYSCLAVGKLALGHQLFIQIYQMPQERLKASEFTTPTLSQRYSVAMTAMWQS